MSMAQEIAEVIASDLTEPEIKGTVFTVLNSRGAERVQAKSLRRTGTYGSPANLFVPV